MHEATHSHDFHDTLQYEPLIFLHQEYQANNRRKARAVLDSADRPQAQHSARIREHRGLMANIRETIEKGFGGLQLLVAITMQTQTKQKFDDSLAGVLRNVAELIALNKDAFAGRVMVMALVDGYEFIDEFFFEDDGPERFFDPKRIRGDFFERGRRGREMRALHEITHLKKQLHALETTNVAHCFFRDSFSFDSLMEKHRMHGQPAKQWITDAFAERGC